MKSRCNVTEIKCILKSGTFHDKNIQTRKRKLQLDKKASIKKHTKHPTAYIILNGETECFPSKIRKKTRMSVLATSIHTILEVLAMAVRQKRKKKRHPDWK